MKIKRTIALGIIGCFLFSSIAWAEVFPDETSSLADPVKIEAVVEHSVKVTEDKIQEKNDLIEIDVTIPVIEGLTDADYQEELNDLIKGNAEKALQEIKIQIEDYAAEAEKNGWEIRPYQLYINYALKTNDDDLLSFTITNYTYTGGANGITLVNCYNIDKKTNKFIELEDLFAPGMDYKAGINAAITKQIELRSQDEKEMFFEGNLGFKGIGNSDGFYLQDKDLVIVFPKYEIAPGYMGTPEFPIDLAGLKESLTAIDKDRILIEGLEIKTVVNQENQAVMIPLRQVAEKLGYTVEWNADEQRVLLTKDQAAASLKIGDQTYVANHKIPYILEPPILINDYTYVPVVFLETVLLYKL